MLQDVNTGELIVTGKSVMLRSNAIGSCIVVAAIDPERTAGGLAHIMLPGHSPPGKDQNKFRYAEDAIQEMILRLGELGSGTDDLKIFIAGGANVLKRPGDYVCKANIDSVKEELQKRGLKIVKESTGGTQRRSLSLNLENLTIHYTIGDSPETLFWKY